MVYGQRGYHDIGGARGSLGAVVPNSNPPPRWAHLTDALRIALGNKYRLHEQRRKIEELGSEVYDRVSYYEIRVLAMLEISIEKGYLTEEQVHRRMIMIKNEGRK